MTGVFKFGVYSIALPVAFIIYGIFTKQYGVALNSLLTVACLIIFILVHKKVPVLNTGTYCSVIVFILLSVFAGRALKIYSSVPNWDKTLHFLSGIIIALIGKQIYIKLKGDSKNKILMNTFAILLAIAVAGIWEMYEFATDALLHLKSQNGSLTDTMWDIILGSVSAVITVLVGKIRLR